MAGSTRFRWVDSNPELRATCLRCGPSGCLHDRRKREFCPTCRLDAENLAGGACRGQVGDRAPRARTPRDARGGFDRIPRLADCSAATARLAPDRARELSALSNQFPRLAVV